MEGVVEVAVSAPPKDLSLNAKGKRTKRSRPQSPIPFTVVTHSSVDCDSYMINRDNVLSVCKVTEEDVDMANCLILLSQGNPSNKKFISKRYIEAPVSSNGKPGMYVYQCKTCGRTFPTFQALGGHRASHKKPKNMATISTLTLALSDDRDESYNINDYKSKKPPPLSLELSNIRGSSSSFDITNKSPLSKIHECTYCGAGFTSGQALGGHMRCHRGGASTPTAPSTNTTLSLSPIPTTSRGALSLNRSNHDRDRKKKRVDLKTTNVVSLDLNLPAQLEDDHQIQQKQQVVLSTIRFIECQH